MASSQETAPVWWESATFLAAWTEYAWDGLADAHGGSQYRRAVQEWCCHGCPPQVHAWIAEWLERADGWWEMDSGALDAEDDE